MAGLLLSLPPPAPEELGTLNSSHLETGHEALLSVGSGAMLPLDPAPGLTPMIGCCGDSSKEPHLLVPTLWHHPLPHRLWPWPTATCFGQQHLSKCDKSRGLRSPVMLGPVFLEPQDHHAVKKPRMKGHLEGEAQPCQLSWLTCQLTGTM